MPTSAGATAWAWDRPRLFTLRFCPSAQQKDPFKGAFICSQISVFCPQRCCVTRPEFHEKQGRGRRQRTKDKARRPEQQKTAND